MPLTSDLASQRELLDAAENPIVPLFPSGEDDTSRTLFLATITEQDAIRTACATTGWTEQGDPDLLPVYTALAHQLPLVRIVPVQHQADTADFLWSKVRILMGGAGYCNHAPLAAILVSLYPLCPFDGSATIEQWREDISKAHKACGWPVSMGHARWSAMVFGIDAVPAASASPPDPWMVTLALLHCLKHLRRTQTGLLAYCYNGIGATIKMEDGSDTLGNWMRQKTVILKSLGCPSVRAKMAHPLTLAMEAALSRLTVSSLLTMAPLTALPPHIIAGPWSTTKPDPQHMEGFYQTGLRVDGVWIAEAGRVRPYTGDQSDVVSFAWNFTNPGIYAGQREEITRVIPATYDAVAWPSDTFLAAFPNIVLTEYGDNADAARVLLDLPWFASFLRNDRDFAREYPMAVFLPDQPTFDQSTSQGKTMAAHTYGRVMVPAVPCVGAMDTGSAPDSRALADTLMTHGTVVLEEWTPPRSKGHVLAHAHLQTLITGSSIALGRVMENTGTVKLKHSMVASAKALDIPPDMINRTFFWFMREFTSDETMRQEVVQRLTSGSLAMEMKLQVIGKVEAGDMHTLYAASSRDKVIGFRFDDHGALARLLFKLRTGRDEAGEISTALATMRARHNAHTEAADSSGVVSSLEDGGMTRIRVSALLAGQSWNALNDLAGTLKAVRERQGRQTGEWNTPAELLDAVRVLRGQPNLQAMLPAISSVRGRPTDRVIIQALTTDMRQVMNIVGGTWAVPESSFVLTRGTDRRNYFTFRMEEVAPG